jgi:hypothetical protein
MNVNLTFLFEISEHWLPNDSFSLYPVLFLAIVPR